MAKKESPKTETAKKQDGDESVLVTAAKALGKAAGKVAALAGADPIPEPKPATPKRPRIGKLVKKNKKRLPRREKKAQQKATAKRI